MFESLAAHRFLDSEQLFVLHPTNGGVRYHQRRLQQLFHHGYIDRPPSQLSYYRTRGSMIYALGNKGADVIYQDKPELRGRIDWQQKNKEVKFPYLDHALMISDFRVALAPALKKQKGAELAAWAQGEALKDYVAIRDERGYKRKAPVVPDAFFTIRVGDYQTHFFLEADRSTMTGERFLRKITAYWQWWKEKGHQKKHGIKGFRVLTITISDERKNNLLQGTRDFFSKEKKQGAGIFLFACEKKYNQQSPAAILSPIWISAKDNNLHYLLEPPPFAGVPPARA